MTRTNAPRRLALTVGATLTAAALALGGALPASAQSASVSDKGGDATMKGGIKSKQAPDLEKVKLSWTKKKEDEYSTKTDVYVKLAFHKPVDGDYQVGLDIELGLKGVPGEYHLLRGRPFSADQVWKTDVYRKVSGEYHPLGCIIVTDYEQVVGAYKHNSYTPHFDSACLKQDGKSADKISAKAKVVHYLSESKYSVDTAKATKAVKKG